MRLSDSRYRAVKQKKRYPAIIAGSLTIQAGRVSANCAACPRVFFWIALNQHRQRCVISKNLGGSKDGLE